jgi:MFS family permease
MTPEMVTRATPARTNDVGRAVTLSRRRVVPWDAKRAGGWRGTVVAAGAGGPTKAPSGALGALRHRDFRIFWSTALLSNSAAWMQLVAVPARLYELTESATWLGFAAIAALVPSVILTPIAGVLADRFSRRMILIVTQLGQMAFALTFFFMHVGHMLTPWRILVLLFGNGIVSGIQVSAWQSFVPTLVPRESLVDAVRLNSVQFQAARAIGPGIGGIAVGFFGIGTAFLLNAVTFVPVLLAVAVARPRQAIAPRDGEPMHRALVIGLRYTWQRAALRRAVVTGFVVSALGQSLTQLAAGIASDIYGKSSRSNAGLVAALGVGSLIMGLYIVGWGDRVSRSRLAIWGLVGYNLGVLLIPVTGNYTIGLLAFFICGLSHIPIATSLNTFMQSAVPDEIRGRVLSFYLLGIMLGMPIGTVALGRASDLIGMRETLLIHAVVFAMFTAYVVALFDSLRQLDADAVDSTAIA